MGANTEISWCHHTANLWWGCVEVSALCDHCYAREWAKRYDRAKWGAAEPRLAVEGVWNDLRKFQKNAAAASEIHRVFVGSMMDIFEKPMPVVDGKGELKGCSTDDLRQRFFREVVPASPNLLFLLLTKRPSKIPKYVIPAWSGGAPSNVMFGTSVGTQETADQATPHLQRANGRRFLSVEPLLGPVSLDLDGIDWVIVGGESGSHARPMHPDWATSIRDQCQASGVPFHFKQFGEYAPLDAIYNNDKIDHDRVGRHVGVNSGVPMDEPKAMFRVGKKAAGRILDGRVWDEFPKLSETR